MQQQYLESNLRKVGDPFGIFLSRDNPSYIGYFDVGIGTINFSLSAIIRQTGNVVIRMFYGETLISSIGPMAGLGSVTGTVTTTGDYNSSPGPFLTLKVDGVPLDGYSITECTFVLRAGTNFVIPDSYLLENTTRAPWMEYITSKRFRGESTVAPSLNCINQFLSTTTVAPWQPPGGGGSVITTQPGGGSSGTTTAPGMTTVPPTFPPTVSPPTDPPPSPPDPDDPALVLKSATVYGQQAVLVDWTANDYEFNTYYPNPFGLKIDNGMISTSSEAAVDPDAPAKIKDEPRLAFFTLVFE